MPASARSVRLGDLATALAALPTDTVQRFETLRARAHAIFDEALLPWLPSPNYRERQAA